MNRNEAPARSGRIASITDQANALGKSSARLRPLSGNTGARWLIGVVAGFIEIPFDEVDAKEQEQADLTDVEIIRHIAGVLLAEHDTTRNQRAPAVRESAQPDPEPGLAA